MGQLHFDPVELDEKWRRRHTYRWHPHSLIDRLVDVRASFSTRRGDLIPSISATLSDIESVLLSEARECDDIFDNLLYFTDSEGWAARAEERRGWGRIQHRVTVSCRVNQANNLTARFEPAYLSDSGHLIRAPEWRDMPYLGSSRIAQRPDDEILYIRNVGGLFHSGPNSLVREDRRYAQLADLVTAVFWLSLHRLARRFDVFVLSYVARLTNDTEDIEYGLEVVDVLEDTIRTLASFVDKFADTNGTDVLTFWRECKRTQASGGNWNAAVSKRLRIKGTATEHMTPKVVQTLHEKLSKAFEMRAAEEPRETIVSEIGNRGWRVIESFEAGHAPDAAFAPEAVRKPASLPPKPVAEVGPVSHRHPVRVVPLPSEIQQEFGVASANDLVEYANARLIELGRRSLAEGDYPSNKSSLARLVRLLRGL